MLVGTRRLYLIETVWGRWNFSCTRCDGVGVTSCPLRRHDAVTEQPINRRQNVWLCRLCFRLWPRNNTFSNGAPLENVLFLGQSRKHMRHDSLATVVKVTCIFRRGPGPFAGRFWLHRSQPDWNELYEILDGCLYQVRSPQNNSVPHRQSYIWLSKCTSVQLSNITKVCVQNVLRVLECKLEDVDVTAWSLHQ